ncbi:MAG: carboxypeptidase M32 [Opitutaceae bacterium]
MNDYQELTAHLRRVNTLSTVAELLGWDEQVNLPPGGAALRAEQHAALAEVIQSAAATPRAGELIASLEQEREADEGRKAVVRHARRDYERATKLPPEFVRAKAGQASAGYHAWAKARESDDFRSYAPVLEKNIEFARREAEYLGNAEAPYDMLLDLHDPGLTAAAVERLFGELRRELLPFVREMTAAAGRVPAPALGTIAADAQESFLREVTARIGFDYNHGRIDVSLHPFCSGTGEDIRMTTRYRPDEPLGSLFGAIHETGHGLYEQGLPSGSRGTALGSHAGMAVHESQSRIWENQVGRSRGFWRFFESRLRAVAPEAVKGVSSDELYHAVNRVRPSLIRVEADEVTYNMHIILRFELERALFAGTLAVKDLPEAWREKSSELLGLRPESDRMGVLQDVHWSGGAFGYFPSYCLGNMIASQLWYRAVSLRPGLEEDFARGEFGWMLRWLRENVHAQGRRFEAPELVKRVTGEELSPKPLLRYLRERYASLYLA